MLKIENHDKDSIYQMLKELRYGVFEGLDNYYMLHIDKVARVPDYILDRALFMEQSSLDDQQKRLDKIKQMIKSEYEANKALEWINIRDYISKI